MKERFIELPVYDGSIGRYTAINLSKVIWIGPDKNWTRIRFENKDELLITNEYRDVIESIRLHN